MNMEHIADSVFQLVARIPKGKVTSYKDLALGAGTHARVIGRILHTNVDPKKYPCHRVVHSDGSLAGGYVFGGPSKQQQRLEDEGVVFTSKHKITKDYFFHF